MVQSESKTPQNSPDPNSVSIRFLFDICSEVNKSMRQTLLWIGLLFHTALFAQTSKECELMEQRISGLGNVNTVCSAIYQECAAESAKKTDPKEAQNQCLKNIGDCQMAGQLSGDDLQRAVAQYKAVCKK